MQEEEKTQKDGPTDLGTLIGQVMDFHNSQLEEGQALLTLKVIATRANFTEQHINNIRHNISRKLTDGSVIPMSRIPQPTADRLAKALNVPRSLFRHATNVLGSPNYQKLPRGTRRLPEQEPPKSIEPKRRRKTTEMIQATERATAFTTVQVPDNWGAATALVDRIAFSVPPGDVARAMAWFYKYGYEAISISPDGGQNLLCIGERDPQAPRVPSIPEHAVLGLLNQVLVTGQVDASRRIIQSMQALLHGGNNEQR